MSTEPPQPLHTNKLFDDAVVGDSESKPHQQQLNRKQTGAVGATTSAVRGLLLQPLYLWYRTPLKLFRPLRVDYLATARALLPQEILSQRVSLRGSTLGMISNAVKQRGWSFVPRYVLQPMVANWAVGFALFTTYTAILPAAYAQASSQYSINSREALAWYPPIFAGAFAGLAQSIVATPLDSLRIRFEVEDMVNGRYQSWWGFAKSQASDVGLKGLYRGLKLTMAKDISGYAAFFGLFEKIKNETIDLYRDMAQVACALDAGSISRQHSLSPDIARFTRARVSELRALLGREPDIIENQGWIAHNPIVIMPVLLLPPVLAKSAGNDNMSFKFNFSINDDDGSVAAPLAMDQTAAARVAHDSEHQNDRHAPACEVVPLTMPAVSSVVVDAIYYKQQRLWKRQIDDVQFQLAQQDSMDGGSESAMVQAIARDKNASDVIKGVYEGGLKTWECSIDLLNYVVENYEALSAELSEARVLEIGCGTALPSLHILKTISGVRMTMQDYNRDVLELVTMPNVLCNTILEPSTSGILGDKAHVDGDTESCEIDIDYRRTQVLFGRDTDRIIGERDNPQLTSNEAEEADKTLVNSSDILTRCEFIAGDWGDIEREMRRNSRQHTFNLIITSETIYDTSSYKQLHDLFACVLAKPDSDSNSKSRSCPMVLVAAKTLYFGLTGSVLSFSRYVMSRGVFDIECVWQSGGSMNREIMCLTWKAGSK
ncbi:hypothetical protein IW140_003945 [Coemansia sp. RSA 1813]|nr:hypothetical protein IW140_003945 [Coemansia sp. RSA 1813]